MQNLTGRQDQPGRGAMKTLAIGNFSIIRVGWVASRPAGMLRNRPTHIRSSK
jgi:hypothetical protein